MIPNKIVISKFASEEGADITVVCVLVREKNKDKLIENYILENPQIKNYAWVGGMPDDVPVVKILEFYLKKGKIKCIEIIDLTN